MRLNGWKKLTESLNPALINKIKTDFPGFCKRFLKIKTKKGNIVPFELNEPQLIIWRVLKDMLHRGVPIRIVVLKARQYGISTFMQAFLLWIAMTRQGQHCLIIGQNLDMAGLLFEKAELMYELCPDWVKPERDSKTRGKRLAFGGKSRSLLYVDTAENRDAGRSGTFQHVHCTEIPFWPDAKRTMDGLLQSVPRNSGTTVVVESTAHGEGDYFHALWEGAADPDDKHWNGFTQIFIPWFEMEEYRDPVFKDQIWPEWLEEHQKMYDLDEEQMMFYLNKYNSFDCDMDTLLQEYPPTAEDAFKSSGTPFFNRQSLDHQRKEHVSKPLRTGMYVVRNDKPVWLDGNGSLYVWEQPIKGKAYTIGVDVATGRAADFSVLQVLKGMEQVASFQGKIDADQLADLASWVGKVYNDALIIPERNGVGEATLLRLVNVLEYPNVFTNFRLDTTTGRESRDYGFTMHKGNRMALLDDVNAATRTGTLIIRDDRTLKEMERFVFTDETGKKAEAAPGSHDDMVMALALAVHAASYHASAPPDVVYKDLEF